MERLPPISDPAGALQHDSVENGVCGAARKHRADDNGETR